MHAAMRPTGGQIQTLIALNDYLFKTVGMRYDHAADARDKVDNYFLHGILQTKTGMCITMPMLYLAVAQRLHYPIRPVMAPRHCFLRWVFADNRPAHNIEVTSGGGVISDADYARRFGIPRVGIESGAYLRTLNLREYLGIMLLQNALVLYPAGKHPAHSPTSSRHGLLPMKEPGNFREWVRPTEGITGPRSRRTHAHRTFENSWGKYFADFLTLPSSSQAMEPTQKTARLTIV